MSAARQVGSEKQAKAVSGTAKRAGRRGDPPNRGQDDLSLTREAGWPIVLCKDEVEIGNSGLRRSIVFLEVLGENMPAIFHHKFVKAGAWRTLESGWNVSFSCEFVYPVGGQVKVRYGGGWPFGWDSQKKTLDGTNKSVSVGRGSLVYARVQIRVQQDVDVGYTYIPTGP